MAGLIIVIIVLGFMMSISTSFSVLLQTEAVGANVTSKYLRARSAALAGVGYVVAQMAASDSTYLTYKDRIYFIYASNTTDLNRRMNSASNSTNVGIPGSPSSHTGFKATVVTQWFYGTPATNPIPLELPKALQFKVTNYPNVINYATSTYIKSIGRFLEIDPSTPTVVNATWTAEIIARVSIDSSNKTTTVDYWRPLPVEPCSYATATFFTVGQLP